MIPISGSTCLSEYHRLSLKDCKPASLNIKETLSPRTYLIISDGEWTSPTAGGRAQPRLKEMLVLPWCKISWRWHSGFWLSGAQTLHSFYFGSAPVLWPLVRAPGTAWPFLQAVHRSFVLFGGGMRQSPFPSAGVQSCSLALLPARTVSLRCGCWGDFVEILLPALLTSVCPIREEILALNRPSARSKAELWMWKGDTKILGSTLCMLGIYPSLWRTGTKTWARPVSKVWFLQVTRMQGSLGLLWELSSLSDLFNKQASPCC